MRKPIRLATIIEFILSLVLFAVMKAVEKEHTSTSMGFEVP